MKAHLVELKSWLKNIQLCISQEFSNSDVYYVKTGWQDSVNSVQHKDTQKSITTTIMVSSIIFWHTQNAKTTRSQISLEVISLSHLGDETLWKFFSAFKTWSVSTT
jgi:hypothetical protein